MRRVLIFLTTSISFVLISGESSAQLRISGTVFDSSRLYVIPGVKVFSTSGRETVTDSIGAYHIEASRTDSIYFFYAEKNSIKYPVKDMQDPSAFDISMLVNAKNKYKLLKEVRVYSDSYQLDSMENRQQYANVFDNTGARLKTGMNPSTGAAGLDIGSIVQLFQFRRNRQQKSFQQRLIQQEQDSYVDYRFNNQLITRMTGLTGTDLENYKKIYRPTYEFIIASSLVNFYTYILNTSYAFKAQRGIK